MSNDQDINNALQKLKDSYDLVEDLLRKDSDELALNIAESSRANLIFIFRKKIYHFIAFELLLKCFPEDAIDLVTLP